nr:ribonuclease H-like domain-containing protein [Tanacetum cinerariifolium]
MFSMRVKRFYKKTGRKLEFNGKEPIGFDKTKVECYNCHKRWHFAIDCKSAKNSENKSRDAGNVGYKGTDNEKKATNFALMAFTSNPLSSSSLNSEREKLSKANIEIIGYQYGLESIEGQLRVHQQNEVIYEEKIAVLEYEVKDKSYDNQFHEKQVLDIREEEVTKTVFDNRSSDEENSLANDRFKKDKMAKKSVLPTNVRKGTGHRESRLVWNDVQRINHQNKFAPTTIFTRSGRIPVSAAKPKAAASTSAVKPVITARPKQSLNFSKSKKAVSVVKGNRVTAIKTSAGCV